MLADALIICREVLLGSPEVTALVHDRVYATPMLPPGHGYPCVKLQHISTSQYSRVGFRHAATAVVQLDVWAYEQGLCARIAGVALDVLHGTPTVPGAVSIRTQYEGRSLDESVQPPLHRYRADLAVRVARIEEVMSNG